MYRTARVCVVCGYSLERGEKIRALRGGLQYSASLGAFGSQWAFQVKAFDMLLWGGLVSTTALT